MLIWVYAVLLFFYFFPFFSVALRPAWLTAFRPLHLGEKQVLHFALDYLSMILDPVERKMQHEGAASASGPTPVDQGRGRAWPDVVDVPGPSGATATPARYSPRQHPSALHSSVSATVTSDSPGSGSGGRGAELQLSSSALPGVSRQQQQQQQQQHYDTDHGHSGYLLSLDKRQSLASLHTAERLSFSAASPRSRQLSGDRSDARGGGGRGGIGDPSSLGALHAIVQNVHSPSPDPLGSPVLLSPRESSGRDSASSVVVKSESPMLALYAGDYDPPAQYMQDLRAGGRPGDSGLTGVHGDREALYTGRAYPSLTSAPVYPVALHAAHGLRPPPPLTLGPSDSANGSLPSALGSGWRGLEEGGASSRPALLPTGLHPLEQSVGAPAGDGRGSEREQNPMSISQLIGGAMKMEPGEWTNYESHLSLIHI